MTATTNLNLTKPTVGGDADAWGGEINTDLDTLDALLAGALYGLTLSAAGSTATYGIAAGAASGMSLATAYTKTASAWAVGTGNGSLDTGSIANNSWYHVWLIGRVDTSVWDVLLSLSATAPTMPASYTLKRRIGSMKTDGSAQWIKFTQNGDEFLWAQPLGDYAAALTAASTPQDITLTTPPGVKTIARCRVAWGNGTLQALVLIDAKDVGALTPNAGGVVNATAYSPGAGAYTRGNIDVRTDTAAKINATCSPDNSCTLYLTTYGWTDTRGKG